MKKKEKHWQVVKMGFLPFDILVVWGYTSEQVRNRMNKIYGLSLENHEAWEITKQLGKTIALETNQTIIWLRHAPKTPKTIATLTHEAVHVMGFISDYTGIPYKHDNDEFITYGAEYIVGEVLKTTL